MGSGLINSWKFKVNALEWRHIKFDAYKQRKL